MHGIRRGETAHQVCGKRMCWALPATLYGGATLCAPSPLIGVDDSIAGAAHIHIYHPGPHVIVSREPSDNRLPSGSEIRSTARPTYKMCRHYIGFL